MIGRYQTMNQGWTKRQFKVYNIIWRTCRRILEFKDRENLLTWVKTMGCHLECLNWNPIRVLLSVTMSKAPWLVSAWAAYPHNYLGWGWGRAGDCDKLNPDNDDTLGRNYPWNSLIVVSELNLNYHPTWDPTNNEKYKCLVSFYRWH